MLTGYDSFIETEVPDNELIVSRTDLRGLITYANETFADISGYHVHELIGQPHNIVRHPDMPCSVFKDLWLTLQQGKMWRGYIKNLRKDGGYYWVQAEVSGVYKEGKLVEYKSMRVPIDKAISIKMQQQYDQLKEVEENQCRIVAYLSCGVVQKLLKVAEDENKDPSLVLETFLNDRLL